VRVQPRHKEILFNWTGCLVAFPSSHVSPRSSRERERIRSNQSTGINRGLPGKLFIEKQARNMWSDENDQDFNIRRGIKERKWCAAIMRYNARTLYYCGDQTSSELSTIRRMQSTSISLRATTKKQRHYVCVRIRDLDPWMPFCMYVVGTSVCGLFRDKLRDLRTIIFVLAQSNGVERGAVDSSGIALSRFSKRRDLL